MSYLYGDSTPSPLDSNFVEFLGHALDMSVHLLLSGERMARCSERISELKDRAGREVRSLEALRASVTHLLRDAPKGDATSPTAACARAIAEHAAETVRARIGEVAAALATSVAAVESEEARERLGCLGALEALLRVHDLPEATTTFSLVHQAGGYVCKRATRTPYGIAWVLDIEIAATHPLGQIARVDTLFPQLEVSAPEIGGWLRKGVRTRTHRLEKLLITEMTLTPKGAVLRMRSSLDAGATGFDVECRDDGGRVRLERVGEQGDAIEPSEADAANLAALGAKLRSLAEAIPRGQGRLDDATLDDRSIVELRDPAVVVDRLVAAMTPIVSEIARHSLSGTELVLKKLLGDNRREEIFVSKATLREKLSSLPDPLRASFDPLGLNGAAPRSLPPIPVSASMIVASATDVH